MSIGWRLRATPAYRKWHRQVLERDNHTCCKCGAADKKVVTHHIKPMWSHPELYADLDNGITVCKDCHREIHKLEKPNTHINVGKTEDIIERILSMERAKSDQP